MEYLEVKMIVAVREKSDIPSVKEWEHHIDRAIDLSEYPEIHHIEGVTVESLTPECTRKDTYGFIFRFKDGGWDIVMFDENGMCHEYDTSDAHDCEASIARLEDYVKNPSMIREYTLPTYSEFYSVLNHGKIFHLPNEDIKAFEKYKKQNVVSLIEEVRDLGETR